MKVKPRNEIYVVFLAQSLYSVSLPPPSKSYSFKSTLNTDPLRLSMGGYGMNIFRIAGDLLHLWSFFVLILKIRAQKSCEGTLSYSAYILCDHRHTDQILPLPLHIARRLSLSTFLLHHTRFILFFFLLSNSVDKAGECR